MVLTTLNKIRAHEPCSPGWRKLLRNLGKRKGDDDPFPLVEILESNGLEDCLWCLRSAPEYDKTWGLYCVECVRPVEHLLTDDKSKNALNVADLHAKGLASYDELKAANAAAWEAAAVSPWRAWEAARAAAWASTHGPAWKSALAVAKHAALAAENDAAGIHAKEEAMAAARADQYARLKRLLIS